MALSMLAQRTVAPVRPARATRATVVVRAASAPRSAAQLVQQVAKPAATALVANLLMAMPSMAAGKLFDFNLTLPIMASEILILMVFLDKFWFTPVGKVLDERDTLLRSQLSTVKGGSEELDRLTKEAEDIIKAARAEVSASIMSAKNGKQAELDKVYNDAKARVVAETDAAIASMQKESEGLLSSLDAQAEKISDQVLRRVLPEGVKV